MLPQKPWLGVLPSLSLQLQGAHTSKGYLKGRGLKCYKRRVQRAETPLQCNVWAAVSGFGGVWVTGPAVPIATSTPTCLPPFGPS